jgi:hypothetical protein
LAVIVLFCISCSVSNRSFSDGSKWIPADFDINKGVLLVETFPGKERLTQDMEIFLTKNYPGKYVIVTQKEITDKSGKYSDISKYRFAFQWNVGTRYNFSSGFTDYDPYGKFYDRVENKLYTTTKKYNNYGNKSYVPFFNSIIKYSSSKSSASVTKN